MRHHSYPIHILILYIRYFFSTSVVVLTPYKYGAAYTFLFPVQFSIYYIFSLPSAFCRAVLFRYHQAPLYI